jgi:AcrR family transcriptional regulator
VAEERGDGRAEQPAAQLGELGPLPGGHHGLSREQILESQRERLLAAIAHEVAARGYRATTITEVVKLASVSTRDFYQHFENKEQCFLAAFDAVRDHLEELILAAVADQPDWPHQVIAALRAALEFLAAEPQLARLCLVEPVSATPTIAIRFREAVLACVPALERGRDETGDGSSLPPSTEDSLLGGIISLATRSILAGDTEKLPALLPDLVEFTLCPYVGAERAAELAHDSPAD